jgi:hypothetical protein
MVFFCLLWLPLFYLFWTAIISENHIGAGGIAAILLGSIVAVVQFFFGAFVEPDGFGLDRWISGFVDIVSLPALLPLVVYLVCIPFGFSRDSGNMASFALLWLIPDLTIKTISWSALNDPLLLVAAPILRTAIVVGISFFVGLIRRKGLAGFIIGIPCILALPPFAASAYWAFFAQETMLGVAILTLTVMPLVLSVLFSLSTAG